eukprot:XP_024999225.1 pre-B-cell leukemia transcription factor-interacting protein 1 isoform X2 [Gallus gallus]
MAQKSDSRDSDNSWVLTGTEGLPVDTVGPERDSASHEDEEEEEEGEEEDTPDAGTADGSEDGAASLGEKQHPEVGGAEGRSDPGAGTELPTSDPTELSAADSWEQEKHNTEPGLRAEGRTAEPLLEEGSCTSSDDDVEGLRRRQVHHQPPAGTPPPAPIPRRVMQDEGNEEGLSANKLLLGALALVAVALLIVSGPADVMSHDATDMEQEAVPDNGSDSPQKPPLDSGDVHSMQSMSVLLDRLAKENQDIRLMQAELQAHKEELQALLQQSEGAAAAAGAQQQSLAKENAELHAALQREAEALRAARAELQRLQARGGPGDHQPHKEQPHDPGAAVHGEGARDEARNRGLLASVRHELAAALQRARGAGGLEGLMEELRVLEERLSRELGGGEGAEAFPGHWKKAFKAEKKERGGHKRDGHRERGKAHRHGWEPHGKEPHSKERHGKEQHSKEPRPHREHREGKAGGKWSHGPRDHHVPPLSHSRPPQGCSGVTDCAHKEGREALGAALEPVQKAQFLQLLEGFMGRLGWGGHFGGVAERLDGAFGANGVFAHDRRRFVDFVEEVEEMLEDVARREHGDEEAADGFEEFVLQHYAGSVGKERGRKAWRQHGGGR